MQRPNLIQHVKRLIRVAQRRDFYFPIQHRCMYEHHGSVYGGWVVCQNLLSPKSVVYSFGLGTDISFDLSLIKQYGLTIDGFDPTPKSIQWLYQQSLPQQFRLHEYGLADFDGTAPFYLPQNEHYVSFTMLEGATKTKKENPNSDVAIDVPVHRLKTIMARLNHDHIDLLKMDIEGAEYTALADILTSGIAVKQLLIEFHHRFASVDLQQTKKTVQLLNQHNFQTFYISTSGDEYCFIKL